MERSTTQCEKVGDAFYRKTKLYEGGFDQYLELENCTIAGASRAGAIAILPNPDTIYTSRSDTSEITVCTCSGVLIRRIKWDKGLIRGLGWSDAEDLVIVTEDGIVRCYYDLHGNFTQFSLDTDLRGLKVASCRFWSHGLVALLSNNNLVTVSNYKEPRPRLLAAPPVEEVHSWAIIPPVHALSHSVEAVLCIGDSIYQVDNIDVDNRGVSQGPFSFVSTSPDGQYIALFRDSNELWIVTSDFQSKVREHKLKTKTAPKNLEWCGNDAVLLAWEDEVHLLGPAEAPTIFYYNGSVHLVPDIDGVRLITAEVCDFLQRLPDCCEELYHIGSFSPALVLLDAQMQLEQGSPKSDENIQMIKSSLSHAVSICVQSARNEFEIRRQKELLKAASFGKSVIDLYSAEDFVETCEVLRLLNAVRDYKVGMPLSIAQYESLTPEGLIQRLTNRNHHLLALRISKQLKLATHKILNHWATLKVRSASIDEASILQSLVVRLEHERGISFEGIARAAFDEGRLDLATRLLDHESRAGKQVPLLLLMSRNELALEKAIASGDSDLVYSVLLHMKKSLSLAAFFQAVSTFSEATALLESSTRQHDRVLLKDLYYQDDRRVDGAHLLFSEALEQSAPQMKLDKLKSCKQLLADSLKDSTAASSYKIATEAQTLIKTQLQLDQERASVSSPNPSSSYMGLSLHKTVYQLIVHGKAKQAQRIASDYAISPKTNAWIRLRALVASRNWSELGDIADKNQKSPIGWEPYVKEIIGAGNLGLAGKKFVAKCTTLSIRERADMWVRCGMISRAGEELVKSKDLEGLEAIRNKVGLEPSRELDVMVSKLRSGR